MKTFFQQTSGVPYSFFTNKHYRKFVSLLLRFGDAPRYKPTVIKVNNLKLRVPDALSFVAQFKEIYTDSSYYFETETKEPVIIDCGSNVGLSCIYFNRLFPKAQIHAFEADPTIFTYLTDNLKTNSVNNVTAHKQAVWTTDTTLHFSSDGADGGSIADSGIEVEAIDLKKFLTQFTKVDLLKIDIEGAETIVVPHCGEELKRVENIFIEYHSYRNSPQQLQEILSCLTENGFHYHIYNPYQITRPFVNPKIRKAGLDLQLNIHAYRN